MFNLLPCELHAANSLSLAPSSGYKQRQFAPERFSLHLHQNPSTSIVELVGQLADGPSDGVIQLFHVCTIEQCRDLGLHRQVVPHNVSLFHSSLSEAIMTEEHLNQLVIPFKHVELPHEIYRHLFIRAGGPASSFDVWLRGRSREQ